MGHTYANLLSHVIFSTKGRRPTIEESFRERLHMYLSGLARQEFGRALCIGSTENHLHALISLRTDVAPSKAIGRWKCLSSEWLHETISASRDFAWQEGYGIFSVSQSSVPAVIRYIQGQREHHAMQTFEDEFLSFLERHQVKYDPRWVWD